jgi:hypothetical protein
VINLPETPLIIHPTPQIFTINELWGLYKDNKIDFNAEYQRSSVWKKEKKQKLIDSILRNYSIGLIILRKKGDQYEVLDGQQRLRAIFEFMENKFSVNGKFTPEHADKKFEDIEKDRGLYANFIAFKIPYLLVESSDDKKVTEIFLRLQEGLALNMAEKLNAIIGKMRDVIIELSKYNDVLKSTGIEEFRFAHRLLMAQIFFLEMETRWDDPTPIFPSQVRLQELTKMYKDYEVSDPPPYVITRIKKTLNFLKETLDLSVIRKRSDFITLYLIASYIDRRYVIDDNFKSVFRNFLHGFLSRVEKVDIRTPKKEEEDYIRYREARRFISSSLRFEIMLKHLLSNATSLKIKDNKREFDYGQKLAIYYRASGKCQYPYCQEKRKEVSFDNAHFHHIKPWKDGGLTIVDNGALMHPSCHLRLHSGTLDDE